MPTVRYKEGVIIVVVDSFRAGPRRKIKAVGRN